MDWRAIDPSIFGTLFERGLDPKKRSQLGAHYTDPATIMRLIDPVIVRPLAAEWEAAKAAIAAHMAKSQEGGDKAYKDARALPRPPRTAAQLPRARRRLRQRQLPLPRAQGAEGSRTQAPTSTPKRSACSGR
jgi:hypothetical protein